MDQDSELGAGAEGMDQFDPQQQLVYVADDGNQYIYSTDQAAGSAGEGMVSYVFGDSAAAAMATEGQSADGDVQYLLVSADEAQNIASHPQYVVMPQQASTSIGTVTTSAAPRTGGPIVISKPVSPSKQSKSGSTKVITTGPGGEGTTAEVRVKGTTARVTVLPAGSKSPGGSTPSMATIPIRIVSRADTSATTTQTISLPVKSSPKVSVSVKSATTTSSSAIISLPKIDATLTPESSTTPRKQTRGRPRKETAAKDPLHSLTKPGGVTKLSKTPNVIVVPINIAKASGTAKKTEASASSDTSSADEKEKEKPSPSPKAKLTPKTDSKKTADKDTPSTSAKPKKATPKPDPIDAKTDQSSPEPTRRSKRESKLSSKLAEWGLVPTTSGSKTSAAETTDDDEDDDDEDDVDEEEDDEVVVVKPTPKVVKDVKKKTKFAAETEDKSKVDDSEKDDDDDDMPLSKTTAGKSTPATTTVVSSQKKSDSGSQTPSTSTKQSPSIIVYSAKSGAAPGAAKKTPTVVKTPAASSVGKAATSKTPLSSSKSSTTAIASASGTKLLQNKSLMCKPIMMTKATSCNPIRITKATQTDEDMEAIDISEGSKTVVPLPVPIFVPAPTAMFSTPTPYPLPLPLPIPVPCFIPTTRNSIAAIMKQLKELHDSLPSDPAEADLLKMAEVVADTSEVADCPASVSKKASGSVDVLEMAMRIASDPQEAEGKGAGTSVNSEPVAKRQRIAVDGLEDDDDQPVMTPIMEEEPLRGPAPGPVVRAPIDDSRMRLKYSYGLNAWKQWVKAKNTEIEVSAASTAGTRTPGSARPKLLKTEILHYGAEELSVALSMFVREVRKPTGQTYAADSIYFLCLGIQHYLFENGRVENIFTDPYYDKFTDTLNELLSTHEVHVNPQGMIVCRVSEEHLWEARVLGAHSPRVLLNTLVYFNTKYFMLQTAESHVALSFSNVLKQWKKGSSVDGKPIRSVYLRYNTAAYPQASQTAGSLDAMRRRGLDAPYFEQLEDMENPLRCPVKLYEFYLSKCPESIRNRSDVFYLSPEPSCVPDSPVWYSTQALSTDAMNKMLVRIRVVREIQEMVLNSPTTTATITAAAPPSSVFG